MMFPVAPTCLALFLFGRNEVVSGFVVTVPKNNHYHHPDHSPSLLNSVVSENIETSDNPQAPPKRFMYMTKEQDEELRRNGDAEAKLMTNVTPLKASKVKGVGSSGGFGNGGGKPNFKAQAKVYAKVLRKEGLVRIDNVLSSTLADNLKEYLVDLRARGTADIENGIVTDSQERFADVLLNQNRCDLKIPLGPNVVNDALHHVLSKTAIRPLIEYVFDSYGNDGSQAELYELNCFMSNSGARRQLVHADNSCDTIGLHKDEPVMLTCFISLQDIDETMGPTTWIPRTHNVEAHDKFYDVKNPLDVPTKATDDSSKDRFLRTSKCVSGTLPKGACVVFDPRTLHCGGANTCSDPDLTRALFYFSFKNPRVDYPGCPSTCGYGIADAKLMIRELCEELKLATKHTKDGTTTTTGSERLDAIACYP